MEGHHSVFRHEQLRKPGLEREFNLLAKQELRVGDLVAHFHEVLQRQVSYRVGILFLRLLELLEHLRSSRAMAVEQFEKDAAIFKRAIQSLAEERNNGVSGIAQ